MPEENNGQNLTRGHSLDELAKGMASGNLSRRQALKFVGGALLGGLLVSIPGVAQAHHNPGHGRPPGHGDTAPGHGGTPPGQGQTCPSGTVELSNGTCATPCTSPADCAAGCSGCGAAVSGNYCYMSPGSQTPCTTDTNCPRGEHCQGRACVTSCSG
jgi:hypothetical protein